ncbi:radical SAM protein [Planosporangium flavigriseum]|nr:radical SAM protein [Planosporangium flavigriseum]NJC65372.1 radical SAM protein [Planosporangium flavigriseum]
MLAPRVVTREERFGAVAYVPDRDHFFGLRGAPARVVVALARGDPIAPADVDLVRVLAEFGIARTVPDTAQRPHFGTSLLGHFDEPPVVDRPLVVNCFATAHCPLRCRYCHADDLMQAYRDSESDDESWRVARMAAAVPALVAVVTGGEPLIRPERTRVLVGEVAAAGKAVVLDSSGVGDLDPVLPVLCEYGVHVRISMDSLDRRDNDRMRPVNRRYLPAGTSSGERALRTLSELAAAGIATTVQTVVTAGNENLDFLYAMRDGLIALGVRNWVLHVVVPAGKAALPRNQELRPSAYVLPTLAELVTVSADERLPLNIRVTGTHRAPNSVLLIGSRGDLYVEREFGGKLRIAGPDDSEADVIEAFRIHVNLVEHVSRYLNGSIQLFPRQR